jgi:hypothetical protein
MIVNSSKLKVQKHTYMMVRDFELSTLNQEFVKKTFKYKLLYNGTSNYNTIP